MADAPLPPILSDVARSYARAFCQHGVTPGGVLWRNAWGQTLRFEMLAGILENETRDDVTVTDLGCGYGALFDFLAEHPCLRHGRYIGLDINEKCLEAARARCTDPRALFVLGHQAIEGSDYAFASGTFNLKGGVDGDKWGSFVRGSLQNLWRKTRKGMAFNMLSSTAPSKQKGLFYSDPETFVAFCREELNAETTLVGGYGIEEWTLLVRRKTP